ncbi:NAD(P)/FAD-dependent oxidoreductase [Bacteroides sp. AM10-21B]|uniref:NAD(P)/FAD-dependent oxidoreductase n=1 Tax=Bacteroides sp. AM10-21B TaxID=2292001 RepID=UPI000E4F2912|nr:FAD-binding protein [Bacteroides sp. AM10-21B]RHJ49032.1 FAD-binding protein [Bacteroides sp. AM10-21B]
MIQEYQLRVLPEIAANEQRLKEYLIQEKGLNAHDITATRILKRSIDARQRTIFVNLTVRTYLNEMPKEKEYQETIYNNVSDKPQVIVVGAGPGGLFAALRLIELGLRPVIVERGKNVRDRKKDLALIGREQTVDPESNYSFGEGGAGAYSDGKLYTRSKKRGNVDKILNVFCQHGASSSILVDAHPHIGTDKLPRVIENMRNTIIDCGGEVHFETRMDALIIENDEVKGIETNTGQTLLGPVILATGHSARDVYRWLAANRVEIEAKGIAVGVRLEHPASLIDQIQYHNRNGRGKYLPTAEYSFVSQVDGRGVYSFCMCPGGFVVPAASGPRQIVVNGMSPSNRGSRWSNSGMVVELRPEDLENEELRMMNEELAAQQDDAVNAQLSTVNAQTSTVNAQYSTLNAQHSTLKMMYFQEALERLCWQQGNMKQTAPAQRMADFTKKKLSYDLPESSYAPGLVSSPLHFWIPPFIANRLSKGFQQFGKYSHGFLTNEATMIGVETRTSAPVRIIRDKDTLQHVRLKGLFPCGEGAGYAGGIVSAGIDGERCAEAVGRLLNP